MGVTMSVAVFDALSVASGPGQLGRHHAAPPNVRPEDVLKKRLFRVSARAFIV